MPDTVTASSDVKIVRCPACRGDSVYAPSNRWRPFCSERCKQMDLGAWASGDYALPASPDPTDPDPDAA